jgi:hypothetical protein
MTIASVNTNAEAIVGRPQGSKSACSAVFGGWTHASDGARNGID